MKPTIALILAALSTSAFAERYNNYEVAKSCRETSYAAARYVLAKRITDDYTTDSFGMETDGMVAAAKRSSLVQNITKDSPQSELKAAFIDAANSANATCIEAQSVCRVYGWDMPKCRRAWGEE